MRNFIPLILICFSLLSGCDDGGKAEIEREHQRAEHAEMERQKAEQAQKEAEKATSTWRVISLITVFSAIVFMFFFMEAMDSSAREDAEKEAEETNE